MALEMDTSTPHYGLHTIWEGVLSALGVLIMWVMNGFRSELRSHAEKIDTKADKSDLAEIKQILRDQNATSEVRNREANSHREAVAISLGQIQRDVAVLQTKQERTT
jgi:hypothetical protein